jgi:hypothetical protein
MAAKIRISKKRTKEKREFFFGLSSVSIFEVYYVYNKKAPKTK